MKASLFKTNFLNAYPAKNKVFLRWSVLNSKKTHKYIIERSVDGQQYEVIGNAENKEGDFHLSFVDLKPTRNSAFYRVKEVKQMGRSHSWECSNTCIVKPIISYDVIEAIFS